MVAFIQGRARGVTVVVVGFLALILAAFATSFTIVLPCGPL
jgi:hypothetical protein